MHPRISILFWPHNAIGHSVHYIVQASRKRHRPSCRLSVFFRVSLHMVGVKWEWGGFVFQRLLAYGTFWVLTWLNSAFRLSPLPLRVPKQLIRCNLSQEFLTWGYLWVMYSISYSGKHDRQSVTIYYITSLIPFTFFWKSHLSVTSRIFYVLWW